MNIALIAHDAKKELMVQFCIAYCGILSRHNICATGTTGAADAAIAPTPVTVTGSIPTIPDCARTVCLPDFIVGEAVYFVEYCASFLQDTAII